MEKVTYRVVEDCINRLIWLYQQHQGDPESGLFCPEAVSLRHRLKTSLVKVIFLTPADFGAKGEELIWRKVFYEVLACVKKRRQSGRLTQRVEALYRCHLLTALGFYQQLMARILLEFPMDRVDVELVDFAPTAAEERRLPLPPRDSATADWAHAAVHRCLLHIGDLYRYLREYKGDVALALVQRYYGAAARFDPRIGLPYNQLGTLDLGSYYNLTAVYYYLRCLSCELPFEGSRRNLATILRKNQRRFDSLPSLLLSAAPGGQLGNNGNGGDGGGGGGLGRPAKPVKQFVVRFLHLFARLLQHPQQHQRRQFRGPQQMQQDADLPALCQSVLSGLAACLQLQPAVNGGTDTAGAASLCVRASEVDPMRPHQLADSALMQAVLSALLCLDSLAAGNSRLTHACTAICLGLCTCVLQCALARCRCALALAAAAGNAAAAPRADRAEVEDAGDEEDADGTVESCDVNSDEDDSAEGENEEARGMGEEEEAGGDFPGFLATSARRRRRNLRRRSRHSGSSSSDASSDCQLAFGYGEEDEDDGETERGEGDDTTEPLAAEDEDDRDAENEAEAEKGLEPAAEAPPPPPAAASVGPFCFSYGIPSALLFQDDVGEGDAVATPEVDESAAVQANAAAATNAEADEAPLDAATTADEAASAAQLQLLGRVRLLQTVKLLLDWLLCQPHLLSRSVQASCLPLWDSLAALLNLLPAPAGEECGIICPEPEDGSPALPEDAHVRGLALFRSAQRHLDFGGCSGRLEECRQRLSALRRFGFLAVQNDQLAFGYDPAARQFLGPTAVRQASRDGQMRSLAEMRLINQVHQLETAVSRAGPAFTASHAVASRQCLTDGLALVQALVRSRRCVLVLPRSSIDHLDRLKRGSAAARQASRYLEAELQSGRALINAHEFPTLAACARQLDPGTTVFLVCRGEAPPAGVPFPVRDLTEFVQQALAGSVGEERI